MPKKIRELKAMLLLNQEKGVIRNGIILCLTALLLCQEKIVMTQNPIKKKMFLMLFKKLEIRAINYYE
jgi:hypothetical protein